ncbi:MAG: DUF2971 domain-containing protein [Anaerolineae bacterium]|nr:DUF2971 domain-containing protein [Anaerolineae bacterium]
MYEQHELCQKPDDEHMSIWHYMSFAKFVSVLSKQALFFTKGRRLLEGDPYEGAFPKDHEAVYTRRLFEDHLHHNDIIAVNCWHMNPHESVAMWKMYSEGEEGVAIRSTFDRLTTSFDDTNQPVFIGKIQYIDYDMESFRPDSRDDMLIYLLHKRPCFEYEQELRALVFARPTLSPGNTQQPTNAPDCQGVESTNDGAYIAVSLEKLVDRVYTSPICQPWFTELVKSVMGKYGLEKNVVQSKLFETPLY